MQEKIEEYLAKQEIYELSCQYMRGLDRLDRNLLQSVFTKDAWCDYGFFVGSAHEFVEFALTALADHSANQHMIGNVLLDVKGEEAFGEVYFNAYHKVPGENGFDDVTIAGRYLDRYEKQDGAWKFSYRSERVDWSRTVATQDSYFDLAPDCLRGARAGDAVYDTTQRYKPTA